MITLTCPSPRPKVMEKIGNRFRREVKAFAEENNIPILRLKKPDRSRFRRPQARPCGALPGPGPSARDALGWSPSWPAKEYQWVYSAKDRSEVKGRPHFEFVREQHLRGCVLLLRSRS